VVNWPVAILYSGSRIGESTNPSPGSCGEPHSPSIGSAHYSLATLKPHCYVFRCSQHIHVRRITESINKSVVGSILKVDIFPNEELTTFIGTISINARVYWLRFVRKPVSRMFLGN
jgi:hypothetical protein